MNCNGKPGRRATLPLLLTFVRLQPARNLEYRYDASQRLNVTLHDGVPVVAGRGRMLLKTQGALAED